MTERGPAESCRAVLELLGENNLLGPIEQLRRTTSQAIDGLAAQPRQVAEENLPTEITEQLDALSAIALPLADHGGEHGAGAVVASLRRLAFAIGDAQDPNGTVALKIALHHLAWVALAGSLASERFLMIPGVAAIAIPSRYDTGAVPILESADLRHADIFERSADKTYNSFQSWFMASPIRPELASLSADRDADGAIAEAELLAALRFARAESDRTYSQVIGAGGEAERRLRAHLAIPEAATQLAVAFAVPPEELKRALNDAYAGIVGPDRLPSHSALFPEEASDE